MKDGERHLVCFIVLAMLLSIIPAMKAWPTWKPEYALNSPEINQWYKDQQLNPATWERLGSPSWHGCCEKGDVFKTQFRVGEDRSDQWFYLSKEGTWKQVPPDIIHWGQHAPNGLPTLFIYWTGQELCFYPPEEGI